MTPSSNYQGPVEVAVGRALGPHKALRSINVVADTTFNRVDPNRPGAEVGIRGNSSWHRNQLDHPAVGLQDEGFGRRFGITVAKAVQPPLGRGPPAPISNRSRANLQALDPEEVFIVSYLVELFVPVFLPVALGGLRACSTGTGRLDVDRQTVTFSFEVRRSTVRLHFVKLDSETGPDQPFA